MKYENIIKANFKDRPNRFIANIVIDGKVQVCHVKNTGRCKELLTDNAVIYVQKCSNPNRKTAFDLIAVEKGERLINMDSQVPNKVVYDWLLNTEPFGKITFIKPECKYKNSRFDFYFEIGKEKCFAEVKGVTLENDGVVSFPDAPSERAVKHLNELIEAKKEGYRCFVVFVVQMKGVKYFIPNYQNHKEFGEMLKIAADFGIEILAMDCNVKSDFIEIDHSVEIKFYTGGQKN